MNDQILAQALRDIPDFPQKGIIFKDITPLLQSPNMLKRAVDKLTEAVKEHNPDYIVGIESRGFIFGTALAYKLGIGFIPVRKPGKLPADTYKVDYDLEYGSNTLEIHKDAFPANSKVAIVDDLLATGGTAKAAIELVEKCGSEVVCASFLIELAFLNGSDTLKNVPVKSILTF